MITKNNVKNKIILKLYLCFILYFYIFPINNNIIFFFSTKKNKIKANLVIPTIYKDFHKVYRNFKYLKEYIDCIDKLILIGDKEIEKKIGNESYFNISFQFINEINIINITKVINLIKQKNKNAIKRSGWYIQQFIKMEYSRMCRDKYYLVWDSDTIPIKNISIFDKENKPYFDVMDKYSKSYFTTLKKIFPELGKIYIYSFVTEHMLIKTEIMRKLINKIKLNKSLKGDTWYEKVINCIDRKDLPGLGFSEFETYGTFAFIYYFNSYNIRFWKSLRKGNQFLDPNLLNYNILKRFSNEYDAISFEKWDIKKHIKHMKKKKKNNVMVKIYLVKFK